MRGVSSLGPRALLVGGLLWLLAGLSTAGDKSDRVQLVNGDELRGDIKGLVHGQLSFKTDSMGTLEIRWEDVVRLTSEYTFQVEVSGGAKYLGSLPRSPRIGRLFVQLGSESVELRLADVVQIRELAEEFLDRLDGYVNMGFSFTQASDVAQFTFGAQVIYKEERFRAQIDLNSIITSQSEQPTAKRNDLTGTYTRLFPNRYLGLGLVGLQQNDELGLQLRTFVGLGGGRVLMQGEHASFSLIGGMLINREDPTGGDPATTNLEALIRGDYAIYYLRSPKLSVNATLNAFPGITDEGRFRTGFDLKFRKEVVSDFNWDLTFFANYDNRPPNPDASTTDFGIITSVSYSF